MFESKEELFNTEISQHNQPMKNMVTAFSGLRSLIQEPGYIFKDGNISSFTFSEIVNLKGNLYLKGLEVKGESLYHLYQKFPQVHSFDLNIKNFLNMVFLLFKTALLIKDKYGFFPPIILNGVYFDTGKNIVTFLPPSVIDFINRFKGIDEQSVLFYCKIKKTNLNESEFTESIAWLIYLFITKQEKKDENPVVDIKNFIPDVPAILSEAIWNNLHQKLIPLKDFFHIIEESIKRKPEKMKKGLPIFRTSSFILIRHKILHSLRKRIKLILVTIVIVAIFFYFLLDYIKTGQSIDYTAGLNSEEVVKLYFDSLENLNLDIIEYILHRNAGRKLIHELSTLYVMSRLSQVYLPQTGESGSSMEGNSNTGIDIFSIHDLEIKKISNDKLPVFSATFKKVINSGEKVSRYFEKQLIYLKQYDDHWYIIKIERDVF